MRAGFELMRPRVPESPEVLQEGVERQARSRKKREVTARLQELWENDPHTPGLLLDFTDPEQLAQWAVRRLQATSHDHEAQEIAEGVRLLTDPLHVELKGIVRLER